MVSKGELSANIWKFGMYSFIDHIRLVWMIMTIYLLWLGFSFTNIGWFETIYALVVVLLELPTGALADLIGKKKALIISCFFNALLFMGIGLMNLPIQYYLIALIGGIAWSFSSGADVALFYDSVKKLGREKDYKKIRGRINTSNQVASILGVFLGPFLYIVNPRLGFLITGGVYVIAALILFTMVEPYKPKNKVSLRAHWKQTVHGLKFTINHKCVMWLIGFFFLSTIGIELFYDFWQQPLLVHNGFEVKYFGFIFAGMMVVRGIVSWYTHKIEGKLKENWSIISILILQVIMFYLFSFSNAYVLIIFLDILYGVIAFKEIIFEDYINSYIRSSNRATVLSVKSLIYNLTGAIFYISVGKLLDIYSINYVLIGASVMLFVGALVLFYFKFTMKKV